jgi:hypothetical protein
MPNRAGPTPGRAGLSTPGARSPTAIGVVVSGTFLLRRAVWHLVRRSSGGGTDPPGHG